MEKETSSMDMNIQLGYVHAAWTCRSSLDLNMQLDMDSMDMDIDIDIDINRH
jgi:hypothetical protein